MRTKLLPPDDSNEIVTIEEAMEHSRITDMYDEMVVRSCLDAAIDSVQKWLNRKLYPTNVIGQIENYRGKIILPFPPITNVSKLTATDQSESSVVLVKDTDWKYDEITESIKFINVNNSIRNLTEFRFEFSVGYPSVEEIPAAIKHAIKMTFATLYENREDTVIGASVNIVPLTARRILSAYRVRSQT